MIGLPFSPSAEENKRAILAAIRPRLDGVHTLLEIGSGSGQHAEYFISELAAEHPELRWQCSEMASQLPGLQARIAQANLDNLPAPQLLDLRQARWPSAPLDACYTSNTLHIAGWPEVESLFSGAGQTLRPSGELLIYGPFLDSESHGGRGSAASNIAFDHALRQQHPAMGVRQLSSLRELGTRCGLALIDSVEMPRDNHLLVFQRR